MTNILLAAFLLQPAMQSTAPMGSISFPDGLHPAVGPYFECLRTRSAEHYSFPVSDPAVLDAARDKAVSQCAEVRATAAGDADRVLRAQGFKAEARRQKIETLLSRIETVMGGDFMRAMVARGKAAAAAKAKENLTSGQERDQSGSPPPRE